MLDELPEIVVTSLPHEEPEPEPIFVVVDTPEEEEDFVIVQSPERNLYGWSLGRLLRLLRW